MLPDLERTLQAQANAARTVHAACTEEERQTLGVQFAVDLIPGCIHAGLIQRRRHGTTNTAATGELVRLADAYASEQRTGPGIEALDQRVSVVSAQLSEESRWAPWTPYAHGTLGVEAVMSLPLEGSDRSFGALTLYFDRPIPDPQRVLARAEAFATHLTLALGCGLTIEHQAAALENRTVIGQAQGILMGASRLTADTAFAYLQRLSQHSNRKLRDIAAEVVRNRGPIPATTSGPDGWAPTHVIAAHEDGTSGVATDGGGLPSTVAASDFTED